MFLIGRIANSDNTSLPAVVVFSIEHTRGAPRCSDAGMAEKTQPLENPANMSDKEMADRFASLAVKVVLKEDAALPVLSVLAEKKVRPISV